MSVHQLGNGCLIFLILYLLSIHLAAEIRCMVWYGIPTRSAEDLSLSLSFLFFPFFVLELRGEERRGEERKEGKQNRLDWIG